MADGSAPKRTATADASGSREVSAKEARPSDAWRTNVLLFLLTVASVWLTGGPAFAAALLAILLSHEFGHYFAARFHGVPASLPYFLPLPILSPFGTLGAVIMMDGIRSRRALLDIGAAGPIAGFVVAVPVMILGVALSPVVANDPAIPVIQEGQSLIYVALKWAVKGPIPADHDIMLHPVAFAAWAGFFVTFLNLVPTGQLDGGHIAYALFGERFRPWAARIRLVPASMFLVNWLTVAQPIVVDWVVEQSVDHRWSVVTSALLPWVVWGLLVRNLLPAHPPVEGPRLDPVRQGVGYGCLALFVGLFMPTPFLQKDADPAAVAAAASASAAP